MYQNAKFGEFWATERLCFAFSNLEHLDEFGKSMDIGIL
jgi:hypothetical protein